MFLHLILVDGVRRINGTRHSYSMAFLWLFAIAAAVVVVLLMIATKLIVSCWLLSTETSLAFHVCMTPGPPDWWQRQRLLLLLRFLLLLFLRHVCFLSRKGGAGAFWFNHYNPPNQVRKIGGTMKHRL